MEQNLVEQLENIFDKYYKLNNKYIDILSGIFDELGNTSIIEIMSILNKDKRFIRLNGTSFGLLKWLIDDIQIYLNLFGPIDYKTISELAIEIYKYEDIDNDVLNIYFPSKSELFDVEDVKRIRERYLNNLKLVEDIVNKNKEVLKQVDEDKTLADKLEAYFEDYYKKYKSSIRLSYFKENMFNIEEEQLLRIVNQDKRFYKLSDRNLALVRWIFDAVESELKIRDSIRFERIKFLVQRKFKTNMINIDNLRRIFPSNIEKFDQLNIVKVKEKFLGINDVKTNVPDPKVEVEENAVLLQNGSKINNVADNDKSLVDKIEAYFDDYYKKYKNSVKLSVLKQNILNIEENELLRIVNQDKRFYKLSESNLVLVRWIFDVVESEIKIRDSIGFERIKFLMQRKFKTSTINVNNLRRIFPSNVGIFNQYNIVKIKEKYFNSKDVEVKMPNLELMLKETNVHRQSNSKINYTVEDSELLVDKIEAYFQTEYDKYHCSINLNSKVEQDLCQNIKDIITILDNNKRFYKLTTNNYGLLKWMLDAIEKEMDSEPELGFSQIKKIARMVYKNRAVNIDNLRGIFKPDIYFYDISYIQEIRKKYLQNFNGSNVKDSKSNSISLNSQSDMKINLINELDFHSDMVSKIEVTTNAEGLIKIFDIYYEKYHKSIKLDSRILQEIGLDIKQVREIANNDKRFFKISESNFALLKWLLDKIEEKVITEGYIYFSQIKNIAKHVFGSPKINTYGLRDLFKYKDHQYDFDYITQIRKEYLNGERKTNIANEEILHDSTLDLSHKNKEENNKSKIKDIRTLKDFGLKYGYIYYEDIEELDITGEYQSITELMIDFSELGIELIDK